MGVTTVSNSLILEEWVSKGLKNGDKKLGGGGGGRVDDSNILTFSSHCTRQEMLLRFRLLFCKIVCHD